MVARLQRMGEVERTLSAVYAEFFRRIKKSSSYPWDLIAIRRAFDTPVYSATRKAISEIYQTGTAYVGGKFGADVYPSDTDLFNIKLEADRAVKSFWFQITEDSKRAREQEVGDEKNKQDRKTESLLGTVAQVGVTASLAIGTFSKTNQLQAQVKQTTPAGPQDPDADTTDTTDGKKPKLIWHAQIDEKTCKILPNGNPGCGDLDGQEWDYDDPNIPVPGRLGPNGTHPNCRCVLDLVM